MNDAERVQMLLIEKAIKNALYVPTDAREAMDAFKRGFAKAMLEMSHNRPTKAAESCGLYRNSFSRWLKAGKE